jgi:hypothetical protein
VGSLGRHDRGQWATWQDGKARLLPLTPELEQQKVLGSVVLSLTPAQLDVLGSAEHAGKASLRSAAAKARKALKGKPGEDVERVPVRVLIVEPRADSSGR